MNKAAVDRMAVSAGQRSDLVHLPETWHAAPRRWGHPLHSLCSYFAMFPPRLVRVLVEWLSSPGDGVYDPFSGRGTVALEATLLNRHGFASDANPLAVALSHAKTSIPRGSDVDARLQVLETSFGRSSPSTSQVPEHIRMLYSDATLAQLVFLRSHLDRRDDVDNFIVATALGMLHANHSKTGATRGFSISMPNTFAMAPGYVERYIKEHGLTKPDVNVFAMLRERLKRLDLPPTRVSRGRAWQQDASAPPPTWLVRRKVQLVLSSPPYLQVVKYGKYNWVRLWFLGEDWQDVDRKLTATSSLSSYTDFMAEVCRNLGPLITPDGFVCFVIGDVRRSRGGAESTLNLAEAVWQASAAPLGWQLHAIIADDLPAGGKVSRIWKNNVGRATKTDRILIMSPGRNSWPPLVTPAWGEPSFSREGNVA